MANSARLNEALSLLLQSPPGQTSQVYHDLRGILLDSSSNTTDALTDSTLLTSAAVALEEYNTSQLITANLPSPDDAVPVIICQAGQVPSSGGEKRYLHPKLKKSFAFDHVKRLASDVKNVEGQNEEVESVREGLEKVMGEYVKDRYQDGVSSVFAVTSVPVKDGEELADELEKARVEDAKTPAENTASVTTEEGIEKEEGAAPTEEETKMDEATDDDPVETVSTSEAVTSSSPSEPSPPSNPPKVTYTIHHVGNRYNLSNFWSGRWRASYTLDPSTLLLTSTLSVQVHYFENGNVQLNAAKPRTFQLSTSQDKVEELAKEVVKVISAHEDGWQKGLEESYDELAERAFKALRRQLPLTRQKVDWEKVLNYKLGEELSRG